MSIINVATATTRKKDCGYFFLKKSFGCVEYQHHSIMNIINTTSMSGTRYLHAVSLLHSLNLTTRPILSNMGNNPYARRAQLMGAHIQAMDYIIGNNEQWGRVFEDDIQLHDDYVVLGLEYQDRCPTWVKINLIEFSLMLPPEVDANE